MLEELMKKKGKANMRPEEKDAKKSVVDELRKMASGMMGDELHGMKKVTVASNDKPGLEHGLEKAKAMLSGEDDEASEESPEHEASESSEEEQGEHETPEEAQAEVDDMSEDEVDHMMKLLAEKKAKLSARQI